MLIKLITGIRIQIKQSLVYTRLTYIHRNIHIDVNYISGLLCHKQNKNRIYNLILEHTSQNYMYRLIHMDRQFRNVILNRKYLLYYWYVITIFTI